MRVLVDLNLVLDVLLDREPHAEAAAALWASFETGEAEGLLAAHSVTTLHYLAARSRGRAFADERLSDVLAVFGVAPVDDAVVRRAMAMAWSDFEDAVCSAAGEAAKCHLLATRDANGFKRSTLPVMTATEALTVVRSSRPS